MTALDDTRPVERIEPDFATAYNAAMHALTQKHLSEVERVSLPDRIIRTLVTVVLLLIIGYLGSLAFSQNAAIPEALTYKKIGHCLFDLEPPEGQVAVWAVLENGKPGCKFIPR